MKHPKVISDKHTRTKASAWALSAGSMLFGAFKVVVEKDMATAWMAWGVAANLFILIEEIEARYNGEHEATGNQCPATGSGACAYIAGGDVEPRAAPYSRSSMDRRLVPVRRGRSRRPTNTQRREHRGPSA